MYMAMPWYGGRLFQQRLLCYDVITIIRRRLGSDKSMKLQQLRYACEVSRQGLNVSLAAESLHTSQPGISKQIKSLEDELGVEIFVRHGKRLASVTEPGKVVLAIAERILSEAGNLKRAGE